MQREKFTDTRVYIRDRRRKNTKTKTVLLHFYPPPPENTQNCRWTAKKTTGGEIVNKLCIGTKHNISKRRQLAIDWWTTFGPHWYGRVKTEHETNTNSVRTRKRKQTNIIVFHLWRLLTRQETSMVVADLAMSWLARRHSRSVEVEHWAKDWLRKGHVRWTHGVDEKDTTRRIRSRPTRDNDGGRWNLLAQIRGLKRLNQKSVSPVW